jgi:hypothetical protein
MTQEHQELIDHTLTCIRNEMTRAIEDGRGIRRVKIAGEDVLDEPEKGDDGKLWERGHLTGKVTITIDIEAYTNCPKCGKNHRLIDTSNADSPGIHQGIIG